MSWESVKQVIQNLLPDTGINVISPKKERDAMFAIINEIIASTPDPVEYEWRATDDQNNSVTYDAGDPVLDESRWFIAKVQNTNQKPILPGGSINSTYWTEENANTSRYPQPYEPQLYTYPTELVLHNGFLYLLDRSVVGDGTFNSVNIINELEEDPPKWKVVGIGLEPNTGGPWARQNGEWVEISASQPNQSPNPPSNGQTSNITDNSADLSWDAATDND